ncbi:MAG TPA: DNA primase [Fimbriimonadales bacterium]|nr:DNA primase [Fimbriimonadales bacterium]
MPDELDEIRSRISLVDLVSERVQLTRAGKTFKGLCPFHREKTPSFYIYPEQGRYFCFGCQERGDIFSFVMKTQGLDFKEALDVLAKRAGVTLKPRFQEKEPNQKQLLGKILETACSFFNKSFFESSFAQEYASNRGLTPDIIAEWKIGYAPDSDEELIRVLRKSNFSLRDAEQAGVVTGSESSGYRDFFRNRLIFPVHDERGNLIAFGGRALDDSQPKYLNSKETPLFRKSETLYGLHRAKSKLSQTKEAILVEGYFDVISCHRAGLTEAVAPLGTAFNDRHAKVLKKWCDKVILAYDSDSAGVKASERALIFLKTVGIDCRVALLPPQEDPDRLFQNHGAAKLHQIVQKSVSPLRFRIEIVRRMYPHGIEKADSAFWKEIKKVLATAEDKLEQQQLIQELAALHPSSKIDYKATVAALRKDVENLGKKQKFVGEQTSRVLPGKTSKSNEVVPPIAERVILRAVLRPEFRKKALPLLEEEGFLVSGSGRRLADRVLHEIRLLGEDCDPGSVLENLEEGDRQLFALFERPEEGPLTEAWLEDSIAKLRYEKEKREARKHPDSAIAIVEALKKKKIR